MAANIPSGNPAAAASLYFLPGAASFGAHIVSKWVGVDLNLVNSAEELNKRNPLHAVPTLELPNGTVLTQNVGILQYVARAGKAPELVGGDDAQAQAEVLQWSAFLSTEVHEASHVVFFSKRFTASADEDQVANVRSAGIALLGERLKILDSRLAGRDFIVGSSKTVVDAQAIPMLRWSAKVLPDGLEPFPNLMAFYARLIKDDGVVAAAEAEQMSLDL
mmetsp:Transcript_3861/g.12132  ORF Transcript_3861/g.12132 Transcript_3861/m.12132 type:complete len:219 (+) Transcript_3861:1554-2210(+)